MNTFDYQLLGRLQQDCEYYMGAGGGNKKHLWALDEKLQIQKMKELYHSLPIKPEWITLEDINKYELRMSSYSDLKRAAESRGEESSISQPTVQVEFSIAELAIVRAAVGEYRELIASPTSADRDALGGDWAEQAVNAAEALSGKLADAAERAQSTSGGWSDLSGAAPQNESGAQDFGAREGASEPLLLECHMMNERPELGVSVKGCFVTNPFCDAGMIDEVDPMERWGLSQASAKFVVALNEQLEEAVEDAINAGCLRLQNAAGITDGGYAGVHFSGPELRNQMMQIFGDYIAADINSTVEAEAEAQRDGRGEGGLAITREHPPASGLPSDLTSIESGVLKPGVESFDRPRGG